MNKWQKTLISPKSKISDALQALNLSGLRIALVVDKKQKLLGVITDGDIRRAILKNINLDEIVNKIMNISPTIANINDSKHYISMLMQQKNLVVLPLLDNYEKVVGVEIIDNIIKPPVLDNLVVLMAGGLGSRLLPLTEKCPKPLLKINEKPILEIILENFIEYGFKNFFISVNYKSHMIKKYFGNGSVWGVNIKYLTEEKPLGTAGAISLLPTLPTKPLIVMNSDIITRINFQRLIDFHLENKVKATMCVRKYQQQVPYGVVKVEKEKLINIVEKPMEHYLVNAGIYVLSPDVIKHIKNTYFDMPKLFNKLIENQIPTAAFPVYEYWLDIGIIDEFKKANNEYHKVL